MPKFTTDKKQREKARRGLAQRRAHRRARRRAASAGSNPTLMNRLAWAVLESAWTVQDKLIWPLVDWLILLADAAIWTVEKLGWWLRQRVVWPLQDRLDQSSAGNRIPRVATVGALGAIAIAALGAGVLVAKPGDDPVVAPAAHDQVAQVIATTPVAEPEPEPVRAGPTMNGAKPNFRSSDPQDRKQAAKLLRELRAEDKAKAATSKDPSTEVTSTDDAEEAGAENGADSATPTGATGPAGEGEADGAGAKVSAADDPTRDPLRVARRFANAFVAYEIGRQNQHTEEVFAETTRKPLRQSLADRPPRLPAGGKVPRARVVNVVSGPRKRKQLTVSVGLVRVDGVSELRLDLQRTRKGWLVSTVRG